MKAIYERFFTNKPPPRIPRQSKEFPPFSYSFLFSEHYCTQTSPASFFFGSDNVQFILRK